MTPLRIPGFRRKLLATFCAALAVAILCIFQIPCIYRSLFGMVCPGCGMTRALLAALRFDFSTAFSLHPMFLTLPVLYVYFLFDGRLLGRKADRAILVLIGLGFLANWIIKLISG